MSNQEVEASSKNRVVTTSQKLLSSFGGDAKKTNRLSRYAIVLVWLAMIGVFMIFIPSTFGSAGNIQSIISSQVVLVILAVAVTIPLRTGDFDLSIGVVAAFSATLSAVLSVQHHWSTGLSLLCGIASGALVGVVNAVVIVGIGVDAFITTLGMMTLVTGLTYGISGSQVISGIPHAMSSFADSVLTWGISTGAVMGWVLALLLWYVFEYTPFGRYLLFVGGAPRVAELSGVRVRWVRAAAFVAAGTLSGFAGAVLVSSLGVADPSVGSQFMIPPYAAAFLGTTTLQLGRFNIWGSIIGIYLLATLSTGLELLGASSWVSNSVDGAALVAAVVFAKLVMGRREA
jgi:ribose transport system permease protein